MSAIKLLRVLKSDPDLVNSVRSRISLAPADQGQETPFITYEFIADDPIKDLKGVATLERQEWDVVAESDKYSSAELVKGHIKRVLNAERTEFNASFQVSEYDYDQEADIHRHTLTFLITYQ